MSHIFHHSIIRAYDIRGVYQKTLKEEDAYAVGKAFASFLYKNKKKKICVGCDGRISSPNLKRELIKGLVSSGVEVFDIGVGPTPMLYFSVYHLECDAGIMVTGSHNPKDHNGFKMALKERPFYGNDIVNLAKIAENADFINLDEGSHKIINVENDYVKKILADCAISKRTNSANEVKKRLKIAWDAGNGAAGDVMVKIVNQLQSDSFTLFADIDGNFPNHHPDPTVAKNLEDLKREVIKNDCDIGIAFDGDGDRIGVIDDEGEIIWGDQLMVFFAREVLKKNPLSTIIADVKASKVLFDEIYKAGGKPMMWKTGHSLVKAKMQETNSPLAGEMSGHIFFADTYLSHKNHGYDDALYAAIRIINILASSDIKLSQMRKELPQTFSTPEIRIECDDEKKFSIVDEIKKSLNDLSINFNDVDGIRATNDKGWWLIRASNTQPVLVARCESDSQKNLEILKSDLRNILLGCKVSIPGELK